MGRIVRWSPILMLSLLALAGTGCRWLTLPILLWGKEPTRPVPAEYPYLEGKQVCIAVWADNNTLFEYPNVQLEVSEHVRAAMEPNIKNISFVPNRQVLALQRREPDWDRKDPAVLGARFGADRVLLLELTQYTTREPDSPHLLRGRIAALVRVYDTAHRNAQPAYRADVEVVYPPENPAPWGTDESSLRRTAMETFAAELAGKFYDRKVKVE